MNDLKLGEKLTTLGHNVRYVTQQDPSRNPRKLDVECRIVNTPYLYGLSYGLPEPAGKLLRHLNEEWFRKKVSSAELPELADADLVLTTGRPLLVKLKSATAAPVVHAVRGTVHPLYHRYLARADGLVFWGGCESEYSDERVLSRPHVTLDPAVNESVFYPREIGADVLDRWRRDEELLAAFVGRLEPVKRVEALIDAVCEADADVRLLVLGEGSRRASLEAYAEQVAPDAVTFLGYCEQETVAQVLNAADVFVLASEHENHPIALKEALACGTYCIAPDVGRIRSMVPDEAGTVTPDNNAETLAAVLDWAFNNGISLAGRFERAQTHNTWHENAEMIISLYQRMTRS
jgi:glycosyltransferase involved in cell wall biosynthesis